MGHVAKVFSTGHSQAVRLPKAFRVDTTEMWISKNPVTGEISLKPKIAQNSLKALFADIRTLPKDLPDFLPTRDHAETNFENPLD